MRNRCKTQRSQLTPPYLILREREREREPSRIQRYAGVNQLLFSIKHPHLIGMRSKEDQTPNRHMLEKKIELHHTQQ